MEHIIVCNINEIMPEGHVINAEWDYMLLVLKRRMRFCLNLSFYCEKWKTIICVCDGAQTCRDLSVFSRVSKSILRYMWSQGSGGEIGVTAPDHISIDQLQQRGCKFQVLQPSHRSLPDVFRTNKFAHVRKFQGQT